MSSNDADKEHCDPMVSVLLPVRDGLPYLPASVDSILNQTYGNLELIVVDDGSLDKSREWIAARALQDHRIRLVANPVSGLVGALNYGIGLARGAYVARMDADDIAMPERFARQVAFLEANRHIAVLGTQVHHIDQNGDPFGKASAFPTNPTAISAALMEKGCVIRHPTIMARREALVAIGGYRSALVYAEDFDLWLRMAERYQLANLAEATLFYRLHASSISVSRHLEQQLAHSLSLLSAQRRRMGLLDPIEAGSLLGGAIEADDVELLRLLQSHSALKTFTDGSRSAGVIKAVLDAIEFGRFYHSKRFLVSILSAITQSALDAGNHAVAWRGLIISFRVDPFRTLRSLRGNSGLRIQTGGVLHET